MRLLIHGIRNVLRDTRIKRSIFDVVAIGNWTYCFPKRAFKLHAYFAICWSFERFIVKGSVKNLSTRALLLRGCQWIWCYVHCIDEKNSVWLNASYMTSFYHFCLSWTSSFLPWCSQKITHSIHKTSSSGNIPMRVYAVRYPLTGNSTNVNAGFCSKKGLGLQQLEQLHNSRGLCTARYAK